jgi:thymidylate synthase
MIAQVCNLKVGDFIHTFGDAHLYTNHLDQAKLQISRQPMPLPQLKLNSEITNIFDFKFNDIEVLNYNSHPAIKAEVAI